MTRLLPLILLLCCLVVCVSKQKQDLRETYSFTDGLLRVGNHLNKTFDADLKRGYGFLSSGNKDSVLRYKYRMEMNVEARDYIMVLLDSIKTTLINK
jgi:hypothetical protein